MELTVVGVDHRSTPDEIRARLHLDADARRRVLARIATTFPGCEALLLVTCNRTELVLAEPEGRHAADVWHVVLDEAMHGGVVRVSHEPCGAAGVARARRTGREAAEHLLRVAAGLESAVLGDVDVLRQLRTARDEAVAAGTCGKHLHRLVREALRTGKQVRHRTALAAGGAGIGSATAALVADELSDRGGVVVVGAGVAARGVLTQLRRHGLEDVVVVNRTPARAAAVARTTGACWRPPEDLTDVVVHARAVVVAAPGWQLDADWWDDVLRRRGDRPAPLVVDVCLPRAVAGWYAEVEERVARLAAAGVDPEHVSRTRSRLRRALHHRVTVLRG